MSQQNILDPKYDDPKIVSIDSCLPVTDGQEGDKNTAVATGMLVYPNPAEQTVHVNYHFSREEAQKRIAVYDMTGSRVAEYLVPQAHGSHSIQVVEWTAGVYILRMEEDGQAIHTQKLTIRH